MINKAKKRSFKCKSQNKSHRSIKDEVNKESIASKYLHLVSKNKNLTKLMKKFIYDPNAKMKSVCQSYIYQSNLASRNLNTIKPQIIGNKILLIFIFCMQNVI